MIAHKASVLVLVPFVIKQLINHKLYELESFQRFVFFSDIMFVLISFCLFAFSSLKSRGPSFIRPSIYAYAPTATRSYLQTIKTVLCPFLFCFFVGVAFSEYFCTIAVFSLYGEDGLVRFSLPDGGFLRCDSWLDFFY